MVLKLEIPQLLSQAKENGVVGFLDNNPVGKKEGTIVKFRQFWIYWQW